MLTLALSCAMQPNPSVGALEAVIGEDLSLGGALEPVQADFEVCTISSVIKHGLDMGYFKGLKFLQKHNVYRADQAFLPAMAHGTTVCLSPLMGLYCLCTHHTWVTVHVHVWVTVHGELGLVSLNFKIGTFLLVILSLL